jgi:hypothetical protein
VSGRAGDTFALAYRDPDRGAWWFIATVPPRRNWRGPFPTEAAMRVEACRQVGAGVTITQTKCRPRQLDKGSR